METTSVEDTQERPLPDVIECFGLRLLPFSTQSLDTTVYRSEKFETRGPQLTHRAGDKPDNRWTGIVLVGGARIVKHGGSARNVLEKLQKSARRELQWQ